MKTDYRNRLIAFVAKHDVWIFLAVVVAVCVLAKLKEEGIIFNN